MISNKINIRYYIKSARVLIQRLVVVVVVVLVGALRTDGKVHFQQETGLRLLMQDSFTTFRERGKTG